MHARTHAHTHTHARTHMDQMWIKSIRTNTQFERTHTYARTHARARTHTHSLTLTGAAEPLRAQCDWPPAEQRLLQPPPQHAGRRWARQCCVAAASRQALNPAPLLPAAPNSVECMYGWMNVSHPGPLPVQVSRMRGCAGTKKKRTAGRKRETDKRPDVSFYHISHRKRVCACEVYASV